MKSAVVTGASRGIGHAVTRMLLAEGWHVTGIARTPPNPRIGRGRNFDWLPADLVTATDEFFTEILTDDEDVVDALVHCAGVRGPYGPLAENDPDEWVQTIQTNLIGTYRIVRACLPALQRSDDGRILLFSGGGAFSPEPGYSAYAASKGATVALMETLAEELSGTSVTVNAIAPGFVPTTIHAGTPHEHRQAPPNALSDAVDCVRHLLSSQTQGMTGRTISAQWDDWRNLTPWTIPHLGPMGTRSRHLIAALQRVLVHGKRAI